ncbi:MAG TPA: DnaJ C-terminal domain-containing protein [Ramlibacter sp.]|uniref:DnaJ C-terminal domain-containing protein n=1 Tax=Ramlibacter sp. TaxID=1917967 RepID=UPI002D7E4C43|nr:DnaJ C-terminal domain-containing protein [Ramlibacter sp.]HET8747599.1 DnaJ C-terminal domain-containing protein [Ramlibacter sp.]
MNVEDSYRELGLTPDCTDAEVKAAWRRLAARWHPDRNASPHALRKIQRINRALEEIRRFRASGFGPITDFDGAGATSGRGGAGRALQHAVRLTLEEALAGCIREIEGELVEDCSLCAGSGLQKHASECRECRGTGQARQPLWFAWAASGAKCKACHGSGSVRHACAVCAGTGKSASRKYRCRARIPGGVREGDLLHVHASFDGPHAGGKVALELRVEVAPHPLFTLDEDGTVRCELPVDGFAWVANRWIEVPTPSGLQQMRLKRGYHTYRIKGQGFPGEDGQPADCIVTVVPLFPEEFGKAQEAQIDKLIAANTGAAGTKAHARMATWQRAVKEWAEGR